MQESPFSPRRHPVLLLRTRLKEKEILLQCRIRPEKLPARERPVPTQPLPPPFGFQPLAPPPLIATKEISRTPSSLPPRPGEPKVFFSTRLGSPPDGPLFRPGSPPSAPLGGPSGRYQSFFPLASPVTRCPDGRHASFHAHFFHSPSPLFPCITGPVTRPFFCRSSGAARPFGSDPFSVFTPLRASLTTGHPRLCKTPPPSM